MGLMEGVNTMSCATSRICRKYWAGVPAVERIDFFQLAPHPEHAYLGLVY
jgi:hypothetical protein